MKDLTRKALVNIIQKSNDLIKENQNSMISNKKNFKLFLADLFKAPFVCWKIVLFWKVNYFSMFDSVMENKLENTFQYLIMS